jgi:hypothetical protein
MSDANACDGALVGLAAAAALAAGLLAVSQHADHTTLGYQLAVAERERLELRRGVEQWERRVAALRTPLAASARAPSMKLAALKYPKTWNVVSAATLRSCADAAPVSAAPVVPAAAKGAPR